MRTRLPGVSLDHIGPTITGCSQNRLRVSAEITNRSREKNSIVDQGKSPKGSTNIIENARSFLHSEDWEDKHSSATFTCEIDVTDKLHDNN